MVYFGLFTCVFSNSICTVSIGLCVGAVLRPEDAQEPSSFLCTHTKCFPQLLRSAVEGNLEMGARPGTPAQRARCVAERQISQGLTTMSLASTVQFSCRQGRVDHTVICINCAVQTKPEDRPLARSTGAVLAVTLASPVVQRTCTSPSPPLQLSWGAPLFSEDPTSFQPQCLAVLLFC